MGMKMGCRTVSQRLPLSVSSGLAGCGSVLVWL